MFPGIYHSGATWINTDTKVGADMEEFELYSW